MVERIHGVKPRHAAALALVGWYLMVPPIRTPKDDQPYLDEKVEYPSWKIIHTFATQDDCEAVRDHVAKYARRGELTIFPNYIPVRDTALSLAQEADMECIETNDPRLKEK
jgi:hypothetical protein